jgi:hypothetical protein
VILPRTGNGQRFMTTVAPYRFAADKQACIRFIDK